MTTTPVKDVNSLMNYVRAKQAAGTLQDPAGSFANAFGRAAGQSEMQELPDDRSAQNISRSKGDSPVKTGQDKADAVKKTDTKPETAKQPEDLKDAEDAAESAGGKLMEKVADTLGISVEKVQEAMEALGLTVTDLLNTDGMTRLVLDLEGADMLSLVTDGELYRSLQDILGEVKQTVQTLMSDLGITPEELSAVLEKAKTAQDEIPDEQAPKPQSAEEKAPKLPEGQKDYKVTPEQNGEAVEISVKRDRNGRTESTETTAEQTPVSGTEEEAPKKSANEQHSSGKDAFSKNGGQNGSTQTNMLLEHLLNRESTVKTDAVFDTAMSQRTADTQNIMNQIMDYMKVQVKADMTQMEIQLHPASLGTVNINISSREGVITAQFLTQNEAVKAAVESQIVQLKNSFEEQGLKVEAVEVAVENHSFDRSLNENTDGQEQTKEERKKGHRRINLNDLNAGEENHLDDAEQIAVEMMASDGNTVDYTA